MSNNLGYPFVSNCLTNRTVIQVSDRLFLQKFVIWDFYTLICSKAFYVLQLRTKYCVTSLDVKSVII